MFAFSLFSLTLLVAAGHVQAHASIHHPSMYGFNVTGNTFPYDNRPVSPLADMPFDQWWFHGHLDHPPNPGEFFELPAGKPATTELACNKGATSFFNSSEGGDIRQGDNPCPNSPLAAIHTTGFDDLTGCALAIAYKSDVRAIQPEDFTVFSINQTCVWTRFTDFQVPANMPPCPPEGCHCAWFWIHSSNSGSQQNYMNGFKCNVTGSTSTVPLAQPKVPRRCGADPPNGVMNPTPGNCTYGAKNPFYWFQKERNNMNEGTFSPPIYTDLYNFRDGAQDDIFQNSYDSIPVPSPNQTAIPKLNTSPSNTGVPVLPSSSSIPPSVLSSSTLPSISPSSVPFSSPPGHVYPTPSPSSPPVPPPPAVTVTNTVYVTVTTGVPPPSSTGVLLSSSTGVFPSSSTGALPSSSTGVLPSSSTGSPKPSPSGNTGGPSIIILNKRKPMPMKRMLSTASNLKKRNWGSRRMSNAEV